MNAITERQRILTALNGFMHQRPGLDFANYGDVRLYRSEYAGILRDLHDAEKLLTAVSWRESITADDLKKAFRAFSGRLTWDGQRMDYCTGQYFPTEYRKAVCAVLASALWDYWRTPETTGDDIRKKARKELGARLANRWFN
jgi:hypothetical protein